MGGGDVCKDAQRWGMEIEIPWTILCTQQKASHHLGFQEGREHKKFSKNEFPRIWLRWVACGFGINGELACLSRAVTEDLRANGCPKIQAGG